MAHAAAQAAERKHKADLVLKKEQARNRTQKGERKPRG